MKKTKVYDPKIWNNPTGFFTMGKILAQIKTKTQVLGKLEAERLDTDFQITCAQHLTKCRSLCLEISPVSYTSASQNSFCSRSFDSRCCYS